MAKSHNRSKLRLMAQHMVQGMSINDASLASGYTRHWARKHSYAIVKEPWFQKMLYEETDYLRKSVFHVSREYLIAKMDDLLNDNVTKRSVKVAACRAIAAMLGLDQSTIHLDNKPFVVVTGEEPEEDTP